MKATFSAITRGWEHSDFLLPFIKEQKHELLFMHHDGGHDLKRRGLGILALVK